MIVTYTSKIAGVINYARRVTLQIVASLMIPIYDRNMFIVPATVG
jgi:hypothetical protein